MSLSAIIPTFGYDDFSDWCNELLAGIQTFADGGAMTDDVQNHLNSICESMNGNLTNPMSRETIRIGIGQLLAQLNRKVMVMSDTGQLLHVLLNKGITPNFLSPRYMPVCCRRS